MTTEERFICRSISRFISLIFLSTLVALNIWVFTSYFVILNFFHMSLFGCFRFWTPTRFPELICPRYDPGYVNFGHINWLPKIISIRKYKTNSTIGMLFRVFLYAKKTIHLSSKTWLNDGWNIGNVLHQLNPRLVLKEIWKHWVNMAK